MDWEKAAEGGEGEVENTEKVGQAGGLKKVGSSPSHILMEQLSMKK